MLCQFSFKNFKSYKNETIFDMQAVNNQGFNDSLLRSGNDKKEFLPVSVIYGPNAGGKSNVLKALKCVNTLVMKPILLYKNNVEKDINVEWDPFCFDDTSCHEPTAFEIFSVLIVSMSIDTQLQYKTKRSLKSPFIDVRSQPKAELQRFLNVLPMASNLVQV